VRAAIPSAQLIVSELVANAVLHAGTTVELSVALRGQAIQVSVRDGSPDSVQPGRPGQSAEGGRGLLVVASLATDWGCLRTRDGKVVWASIPA
jgi:anti-sigma regulatory factor (Ser/Thr protein kinase)